MSRPSRAFLEPQRGTPEARVARDFQGGVRGPPQPSWARARPVPWVTALGLLMTHMLVTLALARSGVPPASYLTPWAMRNSPRSYGDCRAFLGT
eukprot:2792131-Pyramimonas_sp.AAC.1